MREERQHYCGLVRLSAGGQDYGEVQVQLTGYVDVMKIPTTSGTIVRDGVTSWDGYLNMTGSQLLKFYDDNNLTLELRFPDDRVGRAVLRDLHGYVTGYGAEGTPFGEGDDPDGDD